MKSIKKIIREELKKYIGDSNPLNLKHIDTWHQAQHLAQNGDIDEAIKIMNKAVDEANNYAKKEKDDVIFGEANYYKATIYWLKKDYDLVKGYLNDKYVKATGNDVVLNRLLNNKDKPYKDAYLSED